MREFPTPANPYRPLAIISPAAGEGPGEIAETVKNIAQIGYGGLVLDPAQFGAGFLGEEWLSTVASYAEACRLLGLFLWLLDGFTAAGAMGKILDGLHPDWRGTELLVDSLQASLLPGLALAPPTALIAYAPGGLEPPMDLLPYLQDGFLQWAPPSPDWEIKCFRVRTAAGEASAAFAWTEPTLVSAWLQRAYAAYEASLGPHLGRTVQGIFALCPTWPAVAPAWHLPAGYEPSWQELAELGQPVSVSPAGHTYLAKLAETLNRVYLAPIRDWCWQHRMRLAGYRLGGRPLPGTLTHFDLGGLPDLAGERAPALEELAALAGISRYHRQEKVACYLPASGELAPDRALIGCLAAAGADLFMLRRGAFRLPEGETALTDYAARIAMAVSAGVPANEAALAVSETPEALPQIGRQVLAMAKTGFEAVCLPVTEALSLGEMETLAAAELASLASEPAADQAMALSESLALRVRKVENWLVYTIFNLGAEAWRGPVALPASGPTEAWYPSTGEQKKITPLHAGEGMDVPVALTAGEALAVVVQPGKPRLAAQSETVKACLRLDRYWLFAAMGDNVLPLRWQMRAQDDWESSFFYAGNAGDFRLAGLDGTNLLWFNDRLLAVKGGIVNLSRYLVTGRNRLRIRQQKACPGGALQGNFSLKGEIVLDAPKAISGPWTLNGYPYFEGPCLYGQTVQIPEELARQNLLVWLEIDALADAAAVRLNGETIGSLPWPPYRLDLGPASIFSPGANLLELVIHARAGGPAAAKGLLGEAVIYFREAGEAEPF